MKVAAAIIAKLAELIQQGRFTELETESVEIKPVPATGAEWKEIQKSVKELPRLFTDRKGVKQDLGDCFPHMEILPFPYGGFCRRQSPATAIISRP